MTGLLFPPFLQQGDLVAIISPSGKIDKRYLTGVCKRLKSWQLTPQLLKHAGSSHGRYAGTIEQRLADLQEAFDSKDVKAILCSRGGYGAVHLLGQIDFTLFKQYPKWLIGFSDITALHCAIQQQGFASLHAPMARHLTVENEDDIAACFLHNVLYGQLPTYKIPNHKLNRKGVAKGILRGGNMAVFSGLHGTPYDIPADNTILFIEDVGERPHAIERMMYNLKLNGVLEKISGLIIGYFTEYEEDRSLGKDLYGALADLVKDYDYPVCFGFPVGHITSNFPLICGAEVELRVESRHSLLRFTL